MPSFFYCLIGILFSCVNGIQTQLNLNDIKNALPSDLLQEIFYRKFLLMPELNSDDLYSFLSTNPYMVDRILNLKDPKLFVPLVDVILKLLNENEHALLYHILNHPLAIDWEQSFTDFHYIQFSEIDYLTEIALGNMCIQSR